MPCIWQGTIRSVYWPHNPVPLIDLPVEIWSSGCSHPEDHCVVEAKGIQHLQFEKYTYLNDIPLWCIISSEITLMASDPTTLSFFNQFAALSQPIAIKASAANEGSTWDLIIYTVSDIAEGSTKIAGRFVDLRITLQLPKVEPPQDTVDKTVTTNPRKKGSSGASQVVDVKAAISQTVMGALRLRGIKRNNPDFKKIYYAMHSLVDISLRKLNPEDINVEVIHSKVEQIWSVIE